MGFTQTLKNKFSKAEFRATYFVIIFVSMILVAIGLRLYDFYTPEKIIPIYPEVAGLIQTDTLESAAGYTTTPLYIPSQTFDSSIFAVGVFTQESDLAPKDSVSAMYSKNNWRFVELFFKPNTSLEVEINAYQSNYKKEIVINEQIGFILTLKNNLGRCHQPKINGPPGRCQLSKILLMEKEGVVISIAADGNNASEGELIEMARSIDKPLRVR
ncbi:hypothetical protein ACFLZY_00185 [Patescibacteria group bacterium]